MTPRVRDPAKRLRATGRNVRRARMPWRRLTGRSLALALPVVSERPLWSARAAIAESSQSGARVPPGRQAGPVAGSFAPGSVETEVDLALRPRCSPELPLTKLSQLVELLFAGCGTRRVPGRSQGPGGISRAQVRASQ